MLCSVNAGKHSPIPAADSDGLISHPHLQQKLGSGEGRKFILSQNLSYNMTEAAWMSPPKRPYRKYTSVDMEHAIQAVKNGTSVASASKQFGIPRITLLYKVKGKYEVNCRIGPSTVLTTTEEEHLVKWLLTISDHGFPATRLQLLDSVQIIMKKLKRPNTFVNDRPGRKWFHSFLKRHPQISEKLTQNLTKARSDLNEVKLRGWFNEVENYVKSKKLENVFTDPRRIFNVDETAFFLAPKEEESSDKPRLEYTQRDLDFIEKEIGIAKLRKFKECHNKEMWHGDIEDTSLYNLWKKIYEEIHNKNEMLEKSIVVSETENTATLDIQDTQHSDLIELEENTIENQSLEMIINITPPNNAEKKIEKENITPITPAKKITVLSNTLLNPPNKETLENNTIIDPSIPSPFKSCLFWPKPKPSKPNKRSREKIPTVATSDQWREYHKRKQEAKAKTEKEKEERKRKREENRILREESKKKKNKQLKATCDDSSDSSIDMVLESEGEGDDWAEISESEDGAELNNNGFKLNDYVIVKYDGHYYPGQIKDIHDEQYHISAMLPSGSDWKWPVLEDIMWYQKDDVIMTIGIPIAKNKRGAMTVPEMEQYLLTRPRPGGGAVRPKLANSRPELPSRDQVQNEENYDQGQAEGGGPAEIGQLEAGAPSRD
ncbi:hypothetical protein NQ318_009969 [Aromia moschata]|uniref:HTH CENPB-type domain-containing protein n=1 Tax=Aromia moschata TaxID=1265417 RepID=A0AAV8YBF8_9CUCU|nr:hypothetical protein NQ318_009969 [Aromia moschata]